MPSFQVALPIGHPDSNLSPGDQASAVADVAAAIADVSAERFAPGQTRCRFHLRPGTLLPITAMWQGELAPLGENNLVVLELAPAQTLHLRRLVASGYPVPRRIICGPAHLESEISDWFRASNGSFSVVAGQVIGALAQETLELGFVDADDYAIDPAWCLHLFDASAAWALPDPASNPLQPRSALPTTAQLAPLNALNGLYMTLQTAGGHTTYLQPASALSGASASFLASQEIAVGLRDAPSGARWRVSIEDLTPGSRRSVSSPFRSPYDAAANVSILPERDLPPGTLDTSSSHPHVYRIAVQFEDGSIASPVPVELRQDLIDVLRQEYEDRGIEVPPRERFGFVPSGWERFDEAPLYKNDSSFGSVAGGEPRIGIDPLGLPLLAEALSHAFERHLHPAGLADDDVRRRLSCDIELLDGYHSPRLHAAVGGSDAAQFGFSMKLKPRADRQREVVFAVLSSACTEVLQALRTANPGRSFPLLEVHLRNRLDRWTRTWRIDAAGTHSEPGPDLTSSDPQDEASALRDGKELDLLFAPADLRKAVEVPAPQPRTPPASAKKVSVIAYGSTNPHGLKQAPFDDPAFTVRDWLKQAYPDDEEPIIELVNDPIALIDLLGGLADRRRDIRFVYTFSHSYSNGLQLLAGGGAQAIADAAWPSQYVHSTDAADHVKDLYGDSVLFGTADDTQFATHQFRISNLKKMPRDVRRRLRENLQDAFGVFLVGCDTNLNPEKALTITQAFATALDVPTWGAGDSSKFYHRAMVGWLGHNEDFGDGQPGVPEVILVPSTPGYDFASMPPERVNGLEIYVQTLIRTLPIVEEG